MGLLFFVFQAEDGIRALVRSRGLGDVYKRQGRGRHIEKYGRFRAIAEGQAPDQGQRPGCAGRELSLIHI